MADITDQLAEVLRKGDPEFASALADALSQNLDGITGYTKAEAGYRKADNQNQRCEVCKHYDNKSCMIVSGPINPNYTCDHFSGGGDSGGDTEKSTEPAKSDVSSNIPADNADQTKPPTQEKKPNDFQA